VSPAATPAVSPGQAESSPKTGRRPRLASTPKAAEPQGQVSPVVDVTGRASAGRTIDLADDVPSSDDADYEGSHLVGTRVVEQLLGARVIEVTEQ
jgi:hypothetical protein